MIELQKRKIVILINQYFVVYHEQEFKCNIELLKLQRENNLNIRQLLFLKLENHRLYLNNAIEEVRLVQKQLEENLLNALESYQLINRHTFNIKKMMKEYWEYKLDIIITVKNERIDMSVQNKLKESIQQAIIYIRQNISSDKQMFSLQFVNYLETMLRDAEQIKWLSVVYYSKQYNQALQICQQIKTQTYDSILLHAKCQYKLGNYDQSLLLLNKLSNLNQYDENVFFYLGKNYLKQNKIRFAEEQFLNIEKYDQLYAKASLQLGLIYQNQNKFEESIEYFDKGLSFNNKYYKLYFFKAHSLMPIKQYNKALKMFEIVLEFDPQCHSAFLNKGYIQQKLNQFQTAIEMFDQALKIDAYDYLIYNNKGGALSELKQYDEAIQMFDLAIRLNPKIAYLYCNKGNALQCQGKILQSMDMYDKAMELDQNYALPYFKKGNIFFQQEKFSQAIQMFDLAIRNQNDWNYLNVLNDSDLAELYNNKGIALAQLGQFNDSIIMIDNAINIEKNTRFYFNKGVALRKMYRFNEAVATYDAAINIYPKDPNLYICKGSSLLSLQNFNEGIKALNLALELDPNHAEAYFLKSLLLMGNQIEAFIMRDRALQINPNIEKILLNCDKYTNI